MLDHMTSTVTELKAHLSAILKRVKAGETLVVTDRRKAIARILPYEDDSLVETAAVRPFKPVRPDLPLYAALDSQALLAAERGDN